MLDQNVGQNRMRSRAAWRALAVALLACGLSAPAVGQGMFGPGKFTISASDDRFSTSGITTVVGRNNRLSKKSLVGGLYLDAHGLYLDPMVDRQKDSGRITRVGFILHNDVQHDSRGGDANMLGVPTEVSFLVDGSRLIKATLANAEETSSGATTYVRMLGTVSVEVRETAILTISQEEMAAIAAARTLAVHIEGRTHMWTCEATEVSKTFLPNLSSFYRQVVAPSARR